MGGITSSFNLSVGSGLSGAGTVASPLTNAGVTSVATGNGLSGGTITTSGTLTLGAPSAGSVGSYASGYQNSNRLNGPGWGGTCSDFYTYNSNGGVRTARGGTWMQVGWCGTH